jgi:hypothetical protein
MDYPTRRPDQPQSDDEQRPNMAHKNYVTRFPKRRQLNIRARSDPGSFEQ